MIHRLPPPPAMGWMQGHKILIPRHVQALDRSSGQIWLRERGIVPVVEGGTHLSGVETLNAMEVQPAAVGPTASLKTILGSECVKPVAPSYFENRGQRMWLKAYGVILTTAVVPTFQFQLVNGNGAYANPLTSGQMLAQNVAITPAASLTGTLEWFLDVLIRVNVTGAAGSLLAVGTLFNDWVTALTFVQTTFKNAVQAAAVAVTGGLLQSLMFDLEVIMGAATAGNTVQAMDYWLGSVN